MPNGDTVTSTHTCLLDLPSLPIAARRGHIFPHFPAGALLSIGQLCDAGCTASLNATTITINRNNRVILRGTRSAATNCNLWLIDVSTPSPTQFALATAPIQRTKPLAIATTPYATIADRIAFLHGALCSPSLSTLTDAIDAGFLTSFPELSSERVRKYPPTSAAMIQGHLDQVRRNARSTQPRPPAPSPPAAPSPITITATDTPRPGARTHHLFAECFAATGKIFTDQTGRFPFVSTAGMTDMLVLYDYDSSYIHVEAMPSRTGYQIQLAYERAHKLLCSRGLRPQLQRLDNEASRALVAFMEDEGVDFQLTPAGSHRRNACERAIRTFKNHMIACVCGTDPNFPLNLWDRLLPQVLLTLNLLRPSRLNPSLSAYHQVFGAFDFNRTPLAPPGTKVLVHEKPANRGTWAPHAVEAWYTGPAMHHYRCYRVWVWGTRAERIADTLAWFPTRHIMPVASSADRAIAAARDLTQALQHPSPASPLAPVEDASRDALHQLASIFADKTSLAPPPGFPPIAARPLPPPPLALPAATPPQNVLDAAPPPPVPRVPYAAPPPLVPRVTVVEPPAPVPRVTNAAPPPPEPRAPTTTQQPIVPQRCIVVSRTQRPAPTRILPPTQRPRTRTLHQTQQSAKYAFAAHYLSAQSISARHSREAECYLFAGAAIDPATGKMLEIDALLRGSEGIDWDRAQANEVGRLAQGVGTRMPKGTNTIFFIPHHAKPKNKKATYIRVVATDRPNKAETKRVRWTVGGDRIHYDGNLATPTADLTTVKCHINHTISTPKGHYDCIDIKDFYLGTPMQEYEYARVPLAKMPAEIVDQYNLRDLSHEGYIMIEIRRGMYGLPQAGILANIQLQTHLRKFGYYETKTPGLYRHTTRPTTFTLVVDDFGICTTSPADLAHLHGALNAKYTTTIDRTGALYLGMTLKWNYAKRYVDMAMPGYIGKALARFNIKPPSRPQHSPHRCAPIHYGKAVQLTDPIDNSPSLSPAEIRTVQEAVGTLLYYGRAVDSTLLVALNSIGSQQSKATKKTQDAVAQLFDYVATHPDATVRFHASDMMLHVHSDASYLSCTNARSRAGGHFFLSSRPLHPSRPPGPHEKQPPINGPIHIVSSTMKNVLSSAAEAELGALFHNAKDAEPLRATLHDLGHPQPPTPITTDNKCAWGIANNEVKQRRSKAIDMRYYWIRDRINQGHFHVIWRPGTENKADYFTKHHPHAHHRRVRHTYLLDPTLKPSFFPRPYIST